MRSVIVRRALSCLYYMNCHAELLVEALFATDASIYLVNQAQVQFHGLNYILIKLYKVFVSFTPDSNNLKLKT